MRAVLHGNADESFSPNLMWSMGVWLQPRGLVSWQQSQISTSEQGLWKPMWDWLKLISHNFAVCLCEVTKICWEGERGGASSNQNNIALGRTCGLFQHSAETHSAWQGSKRMIVVLYIGPCTQVEGGFFPGTSAWELWCISVPQHFNPYKCLVFPC